MGTLSKKKFKKAICWYYRLRPLSTISKKHQFVEKNNNKVKLFFVKQRLINFKNNQLFHDTQTLWLFLYQSFYFSQLFNSKTLLKHLNIMSVIPNAVLPYLIYTSKLIRWKRYNIIHGNEVVEILFLSLWVKDLQLLIKWIRKYFEKNHLKKHRKLFLLFYPLFSKLIWEFNLFLKLKGLRLVLRGKFGKAGSVRKTRKYIKRGKCSYTSKNISLVSQSTVIRTLTGVYSIKIEIFY